MTSSWANGQMHWVAGALLFAFSVSSFAAPVTFNVHPARSTLFLSGAGIDALSWGSTDDPVVYSGLARTGRAAAANWVSQTVPGNSATINPDGTVTADSFLEYYLQSDKSTYTLGENVDLFFSVTNHGPKPMLFEWAPTSRFDLIIAQDQTVVWTLGGPIRSAFGSPPLTLDAGEVFSIHARWDMDYNITDDHAPVPPGDYTLSVEYAGLSLPITIVPEPTVVASLLAGCLLLFPRLRRPSRYNRGQP